MLNLGALNTRMKDFFDVWLLATQFDFRGPELAQAIEKTFENRGTKLDPEPIALTPNFTTAESTQKQWAAFVKRSQLDDAPKTLDEARDLLRRFLLPPVAAILAKQGFFAGWIAPGPWQAGS